MKRSLIDITDFSPAELRALMDTACEIDAHPERYRESCRGRTLAVLFFEPSTRTRLSFEAAMLGLGGGVLGFSEAASSSAAKGESVADTARVVSCYADIIAMRHPLEGAPLAAARAADVPVINAGDGGHCHPTQTLADLLTVYRAKGGFDGLTVAFCGDLKYGRTVHSLIAALARCRGVRLLLVSPPAVARRSVWELVGMYGCEKDVLEQDLAPAIAEAAGEEGVHFLDARDSVPEFDAEDGMHLSADGHRALGRACGEVLRHMLLG